MQLFTKKQSVSDDHDRATAAASTSGQNTEPVASRSYITPEKLKQLHDRLDVHDAILRQTGEEGSTDRLLTRWLNARKGNVEHCVQVRITHYKSVSYYVPSWSLKKYKMFFQRCVTVSQRSLQAPPKRSCCWVGYPN